MNKLVWLSESCSAVARNTECERKEVEDDGTRAMKELMYIWLCTGQGSRQECLITYQFEVWRNVRDGCVHLFAPADTNTKHFQTGHLLFYWNQVITGTMPLGPVSVLKCCPMSNHLSHQSRLPSPYLSLETTTQTPAFHFQTHRKQLLWYATVHGGQSREADPSLHWEVHPLHWNNR